MTPQISIGTLIPEQTHKRHIRIAIRLFDRVMGLSRMQKLYEQNNMQGLSKEAFADKLLEILDVKIQGEGEILSKIPKTGPLVIASNHPFGGLEGVVLARLIGKVRPDLKVLANFSLQIFAELSDYFIFTNPLSERDPKNAPSLRHSLEHVQQGGALLLFPAGKVSYFHPQKQRISEHPWNRLVGKLVQKTDAALLPLFVEGSNSKRFYQVERTIYKLRMLLLGRELLNKQHQTIPLSAGYAINATDFSGGINAKEQSALSRCLSYAVSETWRQAWPTTNVNTFKPLAQEPAAEMIHTEIANLPAEQHLVSYKQYDVYYGYQAQLPNVVAEIARLREWVFREHNEGSGEPRDTDKFDATYTQLFIVQRETGRIIGAYRMGQTDNLLANGGKAQFYLSQMFDFKPTFYNQTEPCLEMGRSFLIPEYQRSFHGLYLLWRGIGAFVCKFPQYRRLYGTVSISKLYDKRSVAIMEKALVTPLDSVSPKTPYDVPLHPEIADFAQQYDLHQHLKVFLKTLEADGKDIPILLKHYMKLGAEFYALGLDGNFAGTPGLLLCVDLLKMPEKLSKLYLADGLAQYKAYHQH